MRERAVSTALCLCRLDDLHWTSTTKGHVVSKTLVEQDTGPPPSCPPRSTPACIRRLSRHDELLLTLPDRRERIQWSRERQSHRFRLHVCELSHLRSSGWLPLGALDGPLHDHRPRRPQHARVAWPSLRLVAEPAKCRQCGTCTSACPMSIDVQSLVAKSSMENAECVLCGAYVDACPNYAIRYSFSAGK